MTHHRVMLTGIRVGFVSCSCGVRPVVRVLMYKRMSAPTFTWHGSKWATARINMKSCRSCCTICSSSFNMFKPGAYDTYNWGHIVSFSDFKINVQHFQNVVETKRTNSNDKYIYEYMRCMYVTLYTIGYFTKYLGTLAKIDWQPSHSLYYANH